MNAKQSDDGWVRVSNSTAKQSKAPVRKNHRSFSDNNVSKSREEVDMMIDKVAEQVDFIEKYSPISLFSALKIFGLGQPSKLDLACRDSRVQLALSASIMQRFKLSGAAFDPLFSKHDQILLQKYSISELKNCADCSDIASEKTVYFCPHLPWQFLEKLLSANLKNLDKIILISNDIRHLAPVTELSMRSYRIPQNSSYPHAFSDTFMFWWMLSE